MDKYANDRYDRKKYIPKGYILPDGEMLTKQYARYHEDMAIKYINEKCYDRYVNDIISDPRDYMIMRVGALQVMSCGRPILLFCNDHVSRVIDEAIASYMSYGWDVQIVPNPYISVRNYLYNKLYEGTNLMDEEVDYAKEVSKQYVFKRCSRL